MEITDSWQERTSTKILVPRALFVSKRLPLGGKRTQTTLPPLQGMTGVHGDVVENFRRNRDQLLERIDTTACPAEARLSCVELLILFLASLLSIHPKRSTEGQDHSRARKQAPNDAVPLAMPVP